MERKLQPAELIRGHAVLRHDLAAARLGARHLERQWREAQGHPLAHL